MAALPSGQAGVVETAREISSAGKQLQWELKPPFTEFVGIDSDSDHFPLGLVRERWSKDALERYDLEREVFESRLLEDARVACEYFGVDGCRKGWFFVKSEGARLSYGVVARLGDLVNNTAPHSLIYVDIPIGLRDESGQPRVCDTAARQLLGAKRRSSVFPAPLRAILNEPTHQAATAKSKKLSGKGLSQQAFAIVPKIREVDELLADDIAARSMVREVHPELCFWGLAGSTAMSHRKKTKDGFEERMNVLSRVMPEAEGIVNLAMNDFLRKDVARDDIVDALVALVTAKVPNSDQRTAPSNPERDSRNLPMEMVYALAESHETL